jgi:antirestriction protein ArdC
MSKERLEELHETLTERVAGLTSSEAWTEWLRVAAKFHRYSFNNQMLILAQRPDATLVNSYKRWGEIGRQVRKGEKSLGIFAPCSRKVEDPETGEKKVRIVGFRVVSVFDISQTDGADVPEQPMPTLLDGEAPRGLWDALTTVAEARGFTVERGDCRGANGYTDPTAHLIRVREDVSAAQAAKTLAHEVAHVTMGHTEDLDAYNLHRGTAEVEAESAAYLIAQMHGMDPGTYTLPYVAGWAGTTAEDTAKAIRASAERVIKAARLVSDLTLAETGSPVPA